MSGWNLHYLIGMDPAPDLERGELASFERYYDLVHLHEVVERNQGFVRGRRFTVIDRGSGPYWLAMYDLADLESAENYVQRQRVAGVGMSYTQGPVPWTRMTTRWRGIVRTPASAPALTENWWCLLGISSASATTLSVEVQLNDGDPIPETLTFQPAVDPGPGPDPGTECYGRYQWTGATYER